MQILFLTIGSAGDVHPFIGLGLALRERGHQVKIITNPYFQDLIERAGLGFVPIGTLEEFDTIRNNPDLWHPTKGFPTVFNSVIRGFRPTFDALMSSYAPGETVIAASSLGLAARVAQDKYNLPMASVLLQPAILRSTIDPPKLPGLAMPRWMPRAVKRLLYAVADRLVIDPLVARPLNAFRAEEGLAPVHHPLRDWWHSPQLAIGLFPDWFAPPQVDWPPQIKLTGFPLYDELGVSDMPPGLSDFLDAGEPPIVFTPGSAMHHGESFFKHSLDACVKLNRRGILLSRHAGHIPPALPGSVRHFTYAPFSQFLPKVAALVHHGGIGTSAQAMAAGVKQLVVPFAHDQFDNAARMERLGVARTIKAKAYRADRVVDVLGPALSDVSMEARCRAVAGRFAGVDAVGETCRLVESLLTLRNRVQV